MAHKKNRPPCPRCGGTNQRTGTGGWANDETIPVTVAKCLDCNYRGLQFTTWLPDHTSLSALDEQRRLHNRLIHRIRQIRTGKTPKPGNLERIESDRIEVRIRIIPGRITERLQAALPSLRRRQHHAVENTLQPGFCEHCLITPARYQGLCWACYVDITGNNPRKRSA